MSEYDDDVETAWVQENTRRVLEIAARNGVPVKNMVVSQRVYDLLGAHDLLDKLGVPVVVGEESWRESSC